MPCGCEGAGTDGQKWQAVFGDGTVGTATTKQVATSEAAARGGYIREVAK